MAIRMSSEPGINAFRFLLMFTVVLAHSWWLIGTIPPLDPAYRLLITAQCAVPAFFITSGYFLRWQEGDALAVTRWAAGKLLPLYVIWVAIYIVAAWRAGFGSFAVLVPSIFHGGPVRHLWFLPALAAGLSATSLSLRLLGPRLTWLAAVTLAAFGLFSGTYQMGFGLDAHPIRGALFTAPLLVLVGTKLAASNVPRRPFLFGAAMLLAYILQLYDDRFVAGLAGYSSSKGWSTTLATIPFALAVFLFARSLPHTRLVKSIAQRKNDLLILYCIHPMIITAIGWSWHWRGMKSVLAVTVLAYALSLLCAVGFTAAHRRWREFAGLHPQPRIAGAAAASRG
jgi:surface polysaccharide O-acyltransferase-like enzyme